MAGEGETLHLMSQSALDRMLTNIRQQLKDEFGALKNQMVENTMTKQQAADYLKINIRTLERRVKSGVIPSRYAHTNGGTVYFFASELQELLKQS